ncbi:MAG: DUF4349 domain-containing protein [Anaerolineales bacterium]
MKKRIIFIFIALMLALTACGAKSAATPVYALPVPTSVQNLRSYNAGAGATNEQSVAASAPNAALDSSNTTKSVASEVAIQDRLITMNVDLSIVVADPQKKMDAINQMAKNMGGYLVSMNMSQVYTPSGEAAPQGSISIRIPATKLDNALSQIKEGVVDVKSENRSGQDVTSQYVDLQSQLTNLQKAETDLQEIMDESKNYTGNNSTTKTQYVLYVYNQIVNIHGQIEQIQGQMKYLEETTSTSAINVTLIAEKTIKPIEIGGWKPRGVARDAVQALVKFLQGFVNFIIYFVLLVLPVLILVLGPIALIVWGIVALVKRRKARKVAQVK